MCKNKSKDFFFSTEVDVHYENSFDIADAQSNVLNVRARDLDYLLTTETHCCLFLADP